MNLQLSDKLPDKEGFYYWTNFSEHTPTILYVKKSNNKFWAQNEEFCFEVTKIVPEEERKEHDFIENDYVDKPYRYGDELWCYIPNPILSNGKVIKPFCY